MNINEAFEFLNFISNKNQSGSITPAQFNQLATQAQLEFYQKDYTHWQQTQEITDAMSVFLKTLTTSIPTNGQVLFPTDYGHVTSVRHYFVFNNGRGREVPVKELDNDQYADYIQSEIVMPTLRYPIWTSYNLYMQFEPKNLGQMSMDYFKLPTSPVWAYTVVNGRPVYDPANSVDWELGAPSQNQLIFMMCSYLGINLREGQLVQYAELQKQEQA